VTKEKIMQPSTHPAGSANAAAGARSQRDEPTALEMVEQVVDLTVGFFAALMPALLLAMPCIVLVVVPLVILAVPFAILGAIVALPYLLIRSVRRRRRAARSRTRSRLSAATSGASVS
jgi:Flp pilus assembly protein TadB